MRKPIQKLFGAKQYALALGSGAIGVSFALFRRYHTNGKLTFVDLGSGIPTLILLIVIVVAVARIANRPEK